MQIVNIPLVAEFEVLTQCLEFQSFLAVQIDNVDTLAKDAMKFELTMLTQRPELP